jgi:hypothetical protein
MTGVVRVLVQAGLSDGEKQIPRYARDDSASG